MRNKMQLGIILAGLFMLRAPSAASSLSAYAFTAAGESSCATFGPTDVLRNAQAGGSIAVATPGPGCNVIESQQYFTAAGGPLTAGSTASGGSATTFGSFAYTGSSDAIVDFHSLGVRAVGTLSGATDSFSVRGSEAFAMFDDGFIAPAAVGAAGYVEFNYSFHGSQSTTGRGETTIELHWRKNGGAQFLASRIMNASSGLTFNVNGAYLTSYPGVTLAGTTATADASLSFWVPASAGEHFSLNLALFGSALPASSTGLPGPSTITDDFLNTVTLTSIVGLDGSGNPVSGAVERDSDLTATPEPGAALLTASALLLLLGRFRRPRRR
jgi:hypothetical protein